MFKEICSNGFVIIHGDDVRNFAGEAVCKVPVIDLETGDYENLEATNMVDARLLADYAVSCGYYKPA